MIDRRAGKISRRTTCAAKQDFGKETLSDYDWISNASHGTKPNHNALPAARHRKRHGAMSIRVCRPGHQARCRTSKQRSNIAAGPADIPPASGEGMFSVHRLQRCALSRKESAFQRCNAAGLVRFLEDRPPTGRIFATSFFSLSCYRPPRHFIHVSRPNSCRWQAFDMDTGCVNTRAGCKRSSRPNREASIEMKPDRFSPWPLLHCATGSAPVYALLPLGRDGDVLGRKARKRELNVIALITRSYDIVGRIAVLSFTKFDAVDKVKYTIEADRRPPQAGKLVVPHSHILR